jgi:hypothetical protein
MVQPIDYMGMLPAPDLGASLLQGLQAGAAIRQVRDQRAEQERAQALQQQYSSDLQAALSNPTPQSFAALTAKYPQQREAFKQSWEMLDKGQQDAEFGTGVQVYSALRQNRPEAAMQVLDQQIAALENSGQDAADLKSIRSQVERDPNAAAGYVGLVLSSTDPDRWGKIASEQREATMEPAKLTEAQAKAHKASVDARFAESKAAQDLQKGGWEIQKLANDIGISRQNSQIAALNANIAREKNDLKRQEMQIKVDEKVQKRDADLRGKVSEVASGRSTIDNFLNTADQVLKTPAGVVSSATGTISSVLPTIGQDVADFEETLKTLSSQAFLSQVPSMKGLGALTEAEGKKLEASLANLSLRQSPEKLLSNVQEAQRLMLKARSTLADKYGVPDVIPDRPALESQPATSGFRVLGVE